MTGVSQTTPVSVLVCHAPIFSPPICQGPIFSAATAMHRNSNKIISKETREKQSVSQINRFKNIENRQYLRDRVYDDVEKKRMKEIRKLRKPTPMTEEMKGKLNEAKKKKIFCITTGEIFEFMKDAVSKYKLSHGSLTLTCQGKRNYCGALQDGRKLKWEYV
jgi:hypothetical protein